MDFEKLEVWKKSSRLSADLYIYFKCCKDFGFKDQITRSGLSVPSNIVEGMTRETEREKYRYLSIAKGSCAELRTQIYIGIEVQYIEKETGTTWLNQTRHIAAMLEGLMKKLKPR
ncbi:four helix bundle protein [Vibrio cyclitrophicus]|uniref:four helix bundle protein n=1 Tax=Vibrio cyclitrophicus TaxID=47951 RepID=UPI0002F4B7FC|nr:four helix bundle protein [Vibrio cyclitrophicus]OED75348.1 four helix bundle protein [Vibrio cyclitrophicus ZF65]PMJ76497.1 four helix bundle protein [Vibrio cyclitrophicus]